MPLLHHGHAAAHVRDTACNALWAWIDWDGEGPEPTIEYEIHYEPREITISQACGLVWNCTDIVPGDLVDALCAEGLEIKRRTYAGCARAIVENIKLRIVA
jgi:hypothetical protein